MVRGVPVCEACGYDLSGVALDGRQAPCPECGAWFTAQSPFVLRPWLPGVVWAAAGMCGPTAVLVAGAIAASRMQSLGQALGVGAPLIAMAWLALAAGAPAIGAGALVRHRVLGKRRTLAGAAITLLAIVFNVAGTVALLAWLA